MTEDTLMLAAKAPGVRPTMRTVWLPEDMVTALAV